MVCEVDFFSEVRFGTLTMLVKKNNSLSILNTHTIPRKRSKSILRVRYHNEGVKFQVWLERDKIRDPLKVRFGR